jgi:hypothetical protein
MATLSGIFNMVESTLNSATIFELTALPAQYGDCLWLEYGLESSPNRILVDCGTADTWTILRQKIEALPRGNRNFDLLVITHIDADHIGGALQLLQSRKALGIGFGEIWFNGRKHLSDDILGPKEGDALTQELESADLAPLWNKSAGRGALSITDDGALPSFTFAGMKLTLLSPGIKQLQQLASVWPETIRDAGLTGENRTISLADDMPADTLGNLQILDLARTHSAADKSPANGSSIAFLAEYDSRSILFAADAFASVLLTTLDRLKESRSPLSLDISLCKLPHHGSKANVTEKLIAALNCRHYLFSTSGERFHHPHKICVARVITRSDSPTLYFNYRSEYSAAWDSVALMKNHDYKIAFLGEKNYKVSLYDIVPLREQATTVN